MAREASRRRWAAARAFLAGAAVLWGGLWVLASWWHLSFAYYGVWSAGLTMGSAAVEVFTPPLVSPHRLGGHDVATCQWQSFRREFDPIWWPKWYKSGPPVPLVSVIVPLWIPTAGFGAAAWGAHRRVRRIDGIGKCACGYERAGLPRDAACPECGAIPTGRA